MRVEHHQPIEDRGDLYQTDLSSLVVDSELAPPRGLPIRVEVQDRVESAVQAGGVVIVAVDMNVEKAATRRHVEAAAREVRIGNDLVNADPLRHGVQKERRIQNAYRVDETVRNIEL